MEYSEKITALRESVGMNRKQFCDYLEIPYRTVSDWEAGVRTMPAYVYSLIEYKVSHELLGETTEIKAPEPSVQVSREVVSTSQAVAPVSTVSAESGAVSDEIAVLPKPTEEEEYVIDSRFDSMPWITKEDDQLRDMAAQGWSYARMSAKVQRSPAKIEARLKKLGIIR